MSAFTHEERVRQRAYELFLERRKQAGSDTEDWFRAEAEVLAQEDAMVDETSLESFPASDPPSVP